MTATNNVSPIAASFLAEMDMEMPTTRRLLERVPSEKGAWKPHAKSFSLGHLAQLVARMPGWLTFTLKEKALDVRSGPAYTLETTQTLLGDFDRNVSEARDTLARAKDGDFAVPWSLKAGAQVLFTLPRLVVMRQNMNHLCHHRGQLTVYLRLLDVPLPSIYGPTADERG
jgi:uncharacterized damage-inducible protein DinB